MTHRIFFVAGGGVTFCVDVLLRLIARDMSLPSTAAPTVASSSTTLYAAKDTAVIKYSMGFSVIVSRLFGMHGPRGGS